MVAERIWASEVEVVEEGKEPGVEEGGREEVGVERGKEKETSKTWRSPRSARERKNDVRAGS